MTMRALRGGLGPDWHLDDIDLPAMQLGAVRVRIMAAALNRADLYMLAGTYSLGARLDDVFTAGMEFAGVVEISSPMAPQLPVGTRVMGVTKGAAADYAICHPGTLIPIPDRLSFTEAAALPVGLATEHDALSQARFAAGESVLIVGGTIAIGLVGIQLAKALGASKVIATTTNSAKLDVLRQIGADVAIDTSTTDLTEAVLAATDGEGVDITLDHIGGQSFADLSSATKVQGRIVNIGRLAGPTTMLDLDRLSYRRQRLIGTTFSIRTPDEMAQVCAALSPYVIDAVAEGRITPLVDRVYPPERASEAAARLRSNVAVGKSIIEFSSTEPEFAQAPVANFFGTIAQNGYVVRDLDAAVARWRSLGVGPWFITRDVRPEGFTYRGEPSGMAMDVALANSGDIQIELIMPTNDEPSMYKDFLDAGYEGLQHVAYWTSEYQDLYDRALAAGFTVGQEGAIGGPQGRFCYFDADASSTAPGMVVEISDASGHKAMLFSYVKQAAAAWDGSQPVVEVDAAMLAAATAS